MCCRFLGDVGIRGRRVGGEMCYKFAIAYLFLLDTSYIIGNVNAHGANVHDVPRLECGSLDMCYADIGLVRSIGQVCHHRSRFDHGPVNLKLIVFSC